MEDLHHARGSIWLHNKATAICRILIRCTCLRRIASIAIFHLPNPERMILIHATHLWFDGSVTSITTAYLREAGEDTSYELVHRVAREPLQELALACGLVDDAEAGVDGGADVLVPEGGGGGRAEAGEERLEHPHEHGLLGGRLGAGLEPAVGDSVDDLPERGAREGGARERHHLVERGEGGGGDGGAGLLGADGVEEGPQRRGWEGGERGRAGGGGGEGKAAQRPEGGDERVLGRGVVGGRARVAEAAAHDGEHGAGLGRDRAGEGGGVEAGRVIGGGARVVGLLGDGVDAAGAGRPGAAHLGRCGWRAPTSV
uniref:Uncharacterized protein n=1 Tax=Arundo donax TaxID=35708 RepID=A0A0A9DF46_ARUDO